MTFPPGTHAMWMRYWLASGGIHPDKDVSLITIPPPQMVANMKVDKMDGFCVGEPWNNRAIEDGIGFTAVTTQQMWKDHPEKVCAFTEEFATKNPKTVKAVLKALHLASVRPRQDGEPAEVRRRSSPGRPTSTARRRPSSSGCMGKYEYGDGRVEQDPNYMIFSDRDRNYPHQIYGKWWLTQFRRWGMVKGAPDYTGIPKRVLRARHLPRGDEGDGRHDAASPRRQTITLFDGTFDGKRPGASTRSRSFNRVPQPMAVDDGVALIAWKRLSVTNLLLPLVGIGLALLVWWGASLKVADLPSPLRTWEESKLYILEPLAKRGEMDQGIALLAYYSLMRVARGFLLGIAIATPLGFLLGVSPMLTRMFDPLMQVMRPISPLAWLPLGLVLFQKSEPAALFAIAVCSMWPTVINTMMGVRAIPQDYWNVAKVLRLSRTTTFLKIIVPATLPYMFTGYRLSLGIAWLVIVASEMLTGTPGVGGFLWQEYNSLIYAHILLAIITIGVVGFVLDRLMGLAEAKLRAV